MCQIDLVIQKDLGGTYDTRLSEGFPFLQQRLE